MQPIGARKKRAEEHHALLGVHLGDLLFDSVHQGEPEHVAEAHLVLVLLKLLEWHALQRRVVFLLR